MQYCSLYQYDLREWADERHVLLEVLVGISIFSDFLVNSKQHNKQSSQQQTIIELRDNPLRYREED